MQPLSDLDLTPIISLPSLPGSSQARKKPRYIQPYEPENDDGDEKRQENYGMPQVGEKRPVQGGKRPVQGGKRLMLYNTLYDQVKTCAQKIIDTLINHNTHFYGQEDYFKATAVVVAFKFIICLSAKQKCEYDFSDFMQMYFNYTINIPYKVIEAYILKIFNFDNICNHDKTHNIYHCNLMELKDGNEFIGAYIVRMIQIPPGYTGTQRLLNDAETMIGVNVEMEILDVIGEGSFGTVMNVNITQNGWFGERALVRKEIDISEELTCEHICEIVIMQKLSLHKHSNVVFPIFQGFSDNANNFYIFMSKMEDLHRFWNKINSKFDSYSKLFLINIITKQILQGCAHIHDMGIVHRDIKPKNILVNYTDCTVKLCDFGLARFVMSDVYDDLDKDTIGSHAGTAFYQPPEIFLDRKDGYSNKFDIWSVGCVVAELCQDRVLFESDDDNDHIIKVINVLGPLSNEEEEEAEEEITMETDGKRPAAKRPAGGRLLEEEYIDPDDYSYFDYQLNRIYSTIGQRKDPIFECEDEFLLNLVEKMLIYNPDHRISAKEAAEDMSHITDTLPNEIFQIATMETMTATLVAMVANKAVAAAYYY